ncbi:hypothetical protein N824_14400 [Pedobacter sp. V48]|nr:hypothetical protein N824_14400 [Pedobacter sp. V48]
MGGGTILFAYFCLFSRFFPKENGGNKSVSLLRFYSDANPLSLEAS